MGSGDMPPNSVHTLADLAAALDALRGARSYRDLDRAVGGHGQKRAQGSVLKSSTLSNLLNGQSVPSRDTVTLFLTACGLSPPEQGPWLAAWERVGAVHLRRPPGAVRVREARARRLGVHASIQVEPGADDLPPYVPRDLDAELRTVVAAAAADGGGMVLLTGPSSVGKTRALFEAVRAAVPEWWLIHPADAAAARALAEQPYARMVVWLDEFQRYMDQPGGLPAGAARRLLEAGAVVVGTLWPEDYITRTALRVDGIGDRKTEDGALLGLARVIDVATSFTPAERERAEQLAHDPRIRLALSSTTVGVTQVLAAGPELIRRWENAPQSRCYGQAVITAALDARRVGVHMPLTGAFLSAAAPAYLSSSQQANAPADWFDQAVRYATQPVHGAAACLTAVAAGMGQVAGYVSADYLHQHARTVRRVVPIATEVWGALVDHYHPDDFFRLIVNAERRGRSREVITLYRRFAVAEPNTVAVELADRLVEADQIEDAIMVLRPNGHFIEPLAASRLAAVLTSQGHIDDAIDVLTARAAEGNAAATRHLVGLLTTLGRVDGLRQLATDGDSVASWALAGLLVAQDRADEAVAVMRRQAASGHERDTDRLARLLVQLGRITEAVTTLEGAADAGGQTAVTRLAGLLVRLERVEDAAALLERAAGAGDLLAAFHLAELLAAEGRDADLRRRAEAGDEFAAERLAGEPGEQDRVDGSRRNAGDSGVLDTQRLAGTLIARGEIDEALAMLRGRADAGDEFAGRRLVEVLATHRPVGELADEVAAGTAGAAARLARWAP